MNLLNQVKLHLPELEKFDKCALQIDHDCSLGVLYDFLCIAQSFVMKKMKEDQDSKSAALSDLSSELPKE